MDVSYYCRYFFLSSQWLAVDEGDGQVDRILHVGSSQEVLAFNHVFFSKTRHKLFDEHLWLSIASRPSKSTFTRLQRLACVVTLVFTTMIANAMFYQQDDNAEGDVVVQIGPIRLSAATIICSIFSALVVVPINTIIVTVFRKSAPKGWKDEDVLVEEELQKQLEQKTADVYSIDGTEYGGMSYEAQLRNLEKDNISYLERLDDEQQERMGKRKKWFKRRYFFPWWTIYIAWSLAIGSTLISAAFVIFYSLEWGKQRSEDWLSSFFLSIVQSIIVIQPVKVSILSVHLKPAQAMWVFFSI